MALVTEIAPDFYRVSIHVPDINIQFNHFLVKDDEPLLFHTGYKWMFPELREAVAKVIDPVRIRWVGFSHFESDECGALNLWLEAAPAAQAVCTFLAATLSVNDFAIRTPRGLADGEAFPTGKYRFRSCSTAHIPHGWDAGVLFEETTRTVFSSDLFFQFGDVEPLTESDVIGRVRQAALDMQSTALSYSVPYTPQTDQILGKLGALKPKTIATMHGSSFTGNGQQAFRDLAQVFQEVFGA